MSSKSCTIKFFLYTKVNRENKGFAVYARIRYNRKKAEFATGEYCKASNWSEETGCPIRHPRLREYLIYIENKVNKIKRDLELAGELISAKILKERYQGKHQEDKQPFLTIFDNYIHRIEKFPEDYTLGTVQHYRTSKMHLSNFLTQKNVADLPIKDFDLLYVKDFDEYLMTTPNPKIGRPMARNTANKYHTKVKTVLLSALEDEMIIKNPYSKFPLKNKKVNRTYLSKEELEKLADFDFSSNLSLDRIRDIFVWSCYTGQRFGDGQNANEANIVPDENQQLWLDFIQGKTKKRVILPLADRAVTIYYKYGQQRTVTGQIIPQKSNQKVNTYLKTIADLVGINKKLTHHVARHTFATTVLLDNDVSLETVQNLLGHDSIKSTMTYAKITRNKKLAALKKINGKD